MKRLVVVALWLAPVSAYAIDTVDANAPISCTGAEVYYPRGDAWAFLAGTACQGANPDIASINKAGNFGVDPGAATLPDQLGHCLWVSFAQSQPSCTLNCPSTTVTPPSELARMTILASMRKWSGYNSGQQKIPASSSGAEWTCPSVAGNGTSDNASMDYTNGMTNGMPSLAFYRGSDVPEFDPVDATQYNKGDVIDCLAPCINGTSCPNPCTGAGCPTAPPLFKCDGTNDHATVAADCGGLTDCTQEIYRFVSVRNVVQFVNQPGDWKAKLKYDAATLAATESIFWPDNGVTITQDMMINDDNVHWQWKDQFETPNTDYFGCNPTDGNQDCYYLENVATHESGHFLGFGHVACANSVMYPSSPTTAQNFTLGVSEEAGVCALYPPAGNNVIPPPVSTTSPVRSQTKAQDDEGCFADADCGVAGETCIFSTKSFYGKTPPSSTNLAAAIPHRGVCAKSCTADSDCLVKGAFMARVCQPFSDDGSVSYCLPGSPNRPKVSASQTTDYCAACESGTDCSSGICLNLLASGLDPSRIPADSPASICSVRCSPASGCDSNSECRSSGAQDGCVPLDVEKCVQAAASTRRPLNSACDATNTCAPGLLCYQFVAPTSANAAGVNACIAECDTNTACPTPDERCLFTTAGACSTTNDCVDSSGAQTGVCQGGQCQTFIGACFKANMKEGESCALPSSATCGLTCSQTTDQAPNCVENPALGCFTADAAHPEKSACYSLCSTSTATTDTLVCPLKSQTCAPLTDANGNDLATGVCEPLSSSFCLLATGVACSADGDCDSSLCTTFGNVKTCTNYCDLRTKAGCPTDTECIDIQLDCTGPSCCDPNKDASCERSRGACKPTKAPLASNCPAPQGAGCGCSSQRGPNALEAVLALAAIGVFLRRKRRA